jgi:hypothetical protein
MLRQHGVKLNSRSVFSGFWGACSSALSCHNAALKLISRRSRPSWTWGLSRTWRACSVSRDVSRL